jgi:hypothetical protein
MVAVALQVSSRRLVCEMSLDRWNNQIKNRSGQFVVGDGTHDKDVTNQLAVGSATFSAGSWIHWLVSGFGVIVFSSSRSSSSKQ